MNLRHEFVEYMPEEIKEGILYISIPFGTMIHKCGCGCGEDVVTPLGPTEWKFTYDGKTISVHPSVGNWSFPCRSHYWIDRSHVRWARTLTMEEVLEARAKTKEYRRQHYAQGEKDPEVFEVRTNQQNRIKEKLTKLWRRIRAANKKGGDSVGETNKDGSPRCTNGTVRKEARGKTPSFNDRD